MQKLYHYVHCPFCIRIRMALGYFNEKWESHVLPYDDEMTPKQLTGVKMLPIFEFENGKIMNESLQIIQKLQDQHTEKSLQMQNLKTEDGSVFQAYLDKLGGAIHNLCMPYFIYTAEFDEPARQYFRQKKEKKRGPFYKLVQNRDQFIERLELLLEELEDEFIPYYRCQTMSIFDIMLASQLWGLYILPEFQFSSKIHQYLQDIKVATQFDYHEDFWKTPEALFKRNSL